MKTSFSSYFLIVLLILLATRAISRPLPNSSSELVSDGIDEHKEETGSLILLKGVEEESCKQMYGFIPCSKSIPGHVFLILVYEYLLFHGEGYVAKGGERILAILGTGFFGASAFQIIAGLPEALILLASGLFSSKEVAQECAVTGVGLLAGSSILNLTLVWGICVIIGTIRSSSYPSDSTKGNSLQRLFFSLRTGRGVVTDKLTLHTAQLMLVSIIPFIIIQFPRFLRSSFSHERIFVVVALVVSVVFLVAYIIYEIKASKNEGPGRSSIQTRQLEYLKHSHLLNHIHENHSKRTLLDADGAPNLAVLRRIFEQTDQDGGNYLTKAELKELQIKFREFDSIRDKEIEHIIKQFDGDNDDKITHDEFVGGIAKWLEEAKIRKNSGNKHQLYEIVQPLIEKRRKEDELGTNLIQNILDQLQASSGSLVTQDGSPDVDAIRRLFENLDLDGDDQVLISELKALVMDTKAAITPQDADTATLRIMEELDISGDKILDEDEFIAGLSKWLKERHISQTPKPEERKDTDHNEKWAQAEKVVGDKVVDKSALAWIKALSLLAIGIVMLGLLAEPLIHSVHNFSDAANIRSFFISFIFVPLATNARIAISAFTKARSHKVEDTSFAFSEIYSTVLMNNLLGFSVLLSLIYFRGLAWNFSIEVLMVLSVSAIVGCLAGSRSFFPVWTSFFAFMLYPLPLILVYFGGDFNWLY